MCVLESGDGISHKVTDELSPIFWGFLKWGYPQIIQDWIILVLKLMGLGNHQCFTTNFYLWTSESRQSRHQSGHLSHGCHFGLRMGGTMGYPPNIIKYRHFKRGKPMKTNDSPADLGVTKTRGQWTDHLPQWLLQPARGSPSLSLFGDDWFTRGYFQLFATGNETSRRRNYLQMMGLIHMGPMLHLGKNGMSLSFF